VQVDCFSYGVVLWEIITKEQTQRGNWRPVLVPEECPAEVEELLQVSLASLSIHTNRSADAGLLAFAISKLLSLTAETHVFCCTWH
jgi:hypothetical protein